MTSERESPSAATEHVLIRLVGGPNAGDYEALAPYWPPPEEWPAEGDGKYERVSFSQLPRMDHPNVMRGVQYEWVPS